MKEPIVYVLFDLQHSALVSSIRQRLISRTLILRLLILRLLVLGLRLSLRILWLGLPLWVWLGLGLLDIVDLNVFVLFAFDVVSATSEW